MSWWQGLNGGRLTYLRRARWPPRSTDSPPVPLLCARRLLQAAAGCIDASAMMRILRDGGSGICMSGGAFRSNGSQVSVLRRCAGGAGPAAQHWFTATPDPQRSVYKPFHLEPHSAADGAALGGDPAALDGSPLTAALPARRNPPHPLWQAWQAVHEKRGGRLGRAQAALQELEARGLQGGLTFAAAVEEEMQLYAAGG